MNEFIESRVLGDPGKPRFRPPGGTPPRIGEFGETNKRVFWYLLPELVKVIEGGGNAKWGPEPSGSRFYVKSGVFRVLPGRVQNSGF